MCNIFSLRVVFGRPKPKTQGGHNYFRIEFNCSQIMVTFSLSICGKLVKQDNYFRPGPC